MCFAPYEFQWLPVRVKSYSYEPMQRFSVDGSNGLVKELSPHQIVGRAIRIRSMPPHMHLRFSFDVLHRHNDAVLKGREYPIVHSQRISQRYAFGKIKAETGKS